MKNSFHIIVITPEKFITDEVKIINKLLALGLETLHFRKPGATTEQLRIALNSIPEKFHNRIILHQSYNLCIEFKLRGVHLPEKTRNSGKQIDFLKKNNIRIISTSFHSVKQLKQNRRKYQYVFLSPVFDSLSKSGYRSNFILKDLKPLLKKHKNIIALGGIDNENILSVKQTGFYGAATLGYIWEAKNPSGNYKKLVSKIK